MSEVAENQELDLANVIADFVAGLPATIQGNIIAFVGLYGLGISLAASEDVVGDTVKTLRAATYGDRFATALKAMAAMDFVLARELNSVRSRIGAPPLLKEGEVSSALFKATESARLGLDLSLRHLEAATSAWQALRAGRLSQACLEDFEDACLSAGAQMVTAALLPR